ncbi:MAG TPA: translation elongation factor EF-P, partial [Pirellulaceae bacterium]|nr:translation elongation factor EF-P [Pirellulaceae bacterium]
MLAKEIKPGAVVVYDGSPILIESMNVQSPSARGAATLYKFRGRNLATKQKTDITLKGGESLNEADFQRRPVKLMYSDATDMHFLDDQDFNEWVLPLEDVGEAINFITEG